MADVPVTLFRKYWPQKLASLKSESQAIKKRYSEAASEAQQVYRIFSDIGKFS
jgi:hypothetical protein